MRRGASDGSGASPRETLSAARGQRSERRRWPSFSTRVSAKNGRLTLTGAKYYTTGSLFADWIDVGAVNDADETVSAIVAAKAPGVEIVDDWDGFGQKLTASGAATFTNVPVEPEHVASGEDRFGYSAAFVQQVHHATLVGIARAASGDAARAVAERRRNYSHAAASRSSADPQVLQVVGRVHSLTYAAGAVMLKAAEALERSFEHRAQPDLRDTANIAAEIEIAQAQTTISSLVLEATSALFDALGASATSVSKSLDRYWRNARTITSHNPQNLQGSYCRRFCREWNAPTISVADRTILKTVPHSPLSQR